MYHLCKNYQTFIDIDTSLKKNITIMNKLTFSLILLLGCILSKNSLFAQEMNHANKLDLLKHVKKEKLRNPIKISDALKAQELLNQQGVRKSRSTETKISNISSVGTEEGEAHIAMDPSNNNKLVLSYMDNNSATGITYPIYTSSNAGQSWTKSSFNALTYLAEMYPNGFVAGGGDPIFAYDKTGKLFFSWIYLVFNPTTPDTAYACMFMASSTNNGSSWTVQPGKDRYIGITALDVNTFESFSNYEGMYDRQWFAMDLTNGPNANTLYCSFVYFPNMAENPSLTGEYVKKKLPAGLKFNANKVQVNSSQSQFGNVAVTSDGNLHVTYADVGSNLVMHSVSTDGGNTFSVPNMIATGTNLFGNQGGGFIHDRENSAVNMVAGGGTNLHVVWTDFPSTPGANYNSFYSHSTDGGATWTAPININTLFGAANKGFMPTVCAYNNRVSIGSYVINSSKVSDYYLVSSSNNGVNWGTPIKVSTQSTNFGSATNQGLWFGDYYNAVRNDSKVYNIWSDGRGTTGSKMYVSVTSEWPTGFTEITPVNSTFSLEQYYPNPVDNILNLDFNASSMTILNIQLCSLEGKIICEQKEQLKIGSQKVSIQMNGLAKGNYVLKIVSDDDTQLSRLIIKQ
jgi:hypothetical protein